MKFLIIGMLLIGSRAWGSLDGVSKEILAEERL